MTLDFTTLLPILTAFIPLLLPLFPGLNNILKALPRSFWEMCVKIVGGPATTIAWPPTPAMQRAALEARRAALLGKLYAGNSDEKDSETLAGVDLQLAALPKGGLLDSILALISGGGGGGLMPILLIVGVVFLMSGGMGGCDGGSGGCKKKPTPAPTTTTTPATGPIVIDKANP